MKVKSESEVAQLSPTLSDPMDWSLPGSSVHGIFQARVKQIFGHKGRRGIRKTIKLWETEGMRRRAAQVQHRVLRRIKN